jgi:hypothetical protein
LPFADWASVLLAVISNAWNWLTLLIFIYLLLVKIIGRRKGTLILTLASQPLFTVLWQTVLVFIYR